MTLAWTRSRALFALAGVAAAFAAPAQAADDKSTIGAVGELFGYSSDPSAASIDYRERPKLVLPPKLGALPPPKADAGRPENWPVDAAAAHRRNSDRYARIPGAAPEEEEKKPGVFERIMGKGDTSPIASGVQEPSRRVLTEPPSGYRRPTMDLAKLPEKDPDKKGGAWWNPMTYIRGGGANSAGAAGQPGQAQQASGGGSSSWLPQMPRFVSGEGRESKD
jgi:hypothetical protein